MLLSPLKLFGCVIAMAVLLLAAPAWAQLPKRDLAVELRVVVESDPGAYSIGTRQDQSNTLVQQVLVRNGEKAILHIHQSIPVQWVQSAQTQSGPQTASGTTVSSSASGVTNALVWLEAGQRLQVKPAWPGGKNPAVVEVDVKSASVSDSIGAELPGQIDSRVVTIITAPLGEWVVIAKSGPSNSAGTYSSDSAKSAARTLQLRVSAR